MTPRLRKLALTAHVTVSVGWLGAVAAFLALNVAGLASADVEVVRGAFLALDLVGRYVIVPASLGSIATGLVVALGTEWGLFRHYWVAAKLVLTTIATVFLLLHQFIAVAAAAALVSGTAAGTLPGPELRVLGTKLAIDASLAIVVLLATTVLSVFKPWGKIRATQAEGSSTRFKVAVVAFGLLVLAFVVSHLAGGGLGHHRH